MSRMNFSFVSSQNSSRYDGGVVVWLFVAHEIYCTELSQVAPPI